MKSFLRQLALLLALPVAYACGSVLGPDTIEPLMVTDSSVYHVVEDPPGRLNVTIGYSYANRTGAPVSLPNCGGFVPPHLERWEEGEWVFAWAPITPSCLSPPVTIEPGETYVDELQVYAEVPGTDSSPPFTLNPVAGMYRMVWADAVWDYQDRLPWGNALPLEMRASNSFELRAPS